MQTEIDVDLAEVKHMLEQAGSFIEVTEELCGESVGLSGLQRDHMMLDADQCGYLGTFATLGGERSLDPDWIEAARMAAYRHSGVRTEVGRVQVAEVESWFLAHRLPVEARLKLAHTETTLGRVVYPMGVHRRTIGVEQLVPNDAEIAEDTEVFRVRGRLDLGDTPVALVRESLFGAGLMHRGTGS